MKDSLMYHCASAFLANLGSLIFKTFWHVAPSSLIHSAQHHPFPSPLFKISASTPEYTYFILQLSVTRFSALLMKFSHIMRNFAPTALAIAQDSYKEDYFRIIIEKYCASEKIKPK